jgi:aspartyl-tRNA(Asn)/glutamyl-tRNA(Gln) amidotransferase subunit A
MADAPWTGDACSLVEAFRRRERSPLEELDATLSAVQRSDLGAVCFVDRERAEAAARNADVSQPFGGVPLAVKELDAVLGWPDTEASVVFADRVSPHTSIMVQRLAEQGGAIPCVQATASEFGGVNLTRTVLHGITRNPWDHRRTPGGSSGGSAAAVAGGLITLATAGDGGGSIRIPAGFCGLVGLKATYGRIPRGPQHHLGNLTTVTGCVTRSVRDTARWFDLCNGHDPRDPLSLPRVQGWEANLGTLRPLLQRRRVALAPNWGGATVADSTWEVIEDAAQHLIDRLDLMRVGGLDTALPRMGAAWSISGMLSIAAELGDQWPDCAEVLTPEIRFGLEATAGRYDANARAKLEARRTALNERMAAIFDPVDGVDYVITATNPDVAFDAAGPLPDTFGGVTVGAGNNGLLTFPANLHGNAAISVPVGMVQGLPVGLQIVGRHFSEPELLELALVLEHDRPWQLMTT